MTLIAPDPSQRFCQGNQQGANSRQTGGGDLQTSTNVLTNGQFIGGDAGDVILIGGAAQQSQQEASTQRRPAAPPRTRKPSSSAT